MKLLLDTHTFIWLNIAPNKLSTDALAACSAPENSLYLSMASAWEMSIKSQLDKLKLPVSWDVMLKRQQADNGLALLPVELKHITRKQPHHHKDPFDRMLISQSQVEDMPLVSRDSQFKHYDIELIW